MLPMEKVKLRMTLEPVHTSAFINDRENTEFTTYTITAKDF